METVSSTLSEVSSRHASARPVANMDVLLVVGSLPNDPDGKSARRALVVQHERITRRYYCVSCIPYGPDHVEIHDWQFFARRLGGN